MEIHTNTDSKGYYLLDEQGYKSKTTTVKGDGVRKNRPDESSRESWVLLARPKGPTSEKYVSGVLLYH